MLTVADLAAGVTPVGLGLGRIGNFINGELYGRPTDVDWCMVFPAGGMCRHPSQLYEAFLEGALAVYGVVVDHPPASPSGTVFGAFLMATESAESWWSFSRTRRTDRFSRRFDLDGTTAEHSDDRRGCGHPGHRIPAQAAVRDRFRLRSPA